MNKVIDKGFRSCRFVSTIVKHPVYIESKPTNTCSSTCQFTHQSEGVLQPYYFKFHLLRAT